MKRVPLPEAERLPLVGIIVAAVLFGAGLVLMFWPGRLTGRLPIVELISPTTGLFSVDFIDEFQDLRMRAQIGVGAVVMATVVCWAAQRALTNEDAAE